MSEYHVETWEQETGYADGEPRLLDCLVGNGTIVIECDWYLINNYETICRLLNQEITPVETALDVCSKKRQATQEENEQLRQQLADAKNYCKDALSDLEHLTHGDAQYNPDALSADSNIRAAIKVLDSEQTTADSLNVPSVVSDKQYTGVIKDIKKLTTQKGEQMLLVTLYTGIEIAVFPRTREIWQDELESFSWTKTEVTFDCKDDGQTIVMNHLVEDAHVSYNSEFRHNPNDDC